MADKKWYVEVIYPNEYGDQFRNHPAPVFSRCIKYGGKVFEIGRPKSSAETEETLEFESRENAEWFARDTAKQLAEWPDAGRGEAFVIQILEDDVKTVVGDPIKGTIGSNKP